MKKFFEHTLGSIAFAALVLACVLTYGPSAMAAEQGVLPDATLSFSGDQRVGQPVTAVFDLKGYTIPNGSYASINVRFLEKPDATKPVVKTGYPRTTLTFQTAGTYRVVFILNEVSKPSCGGVDAKTLLEETVELVILP